MNLFLKSNFFVRMLLEAADMSCKDFFDERCRLQKYGFFFLSLVLCPIRPCLPSLFVEKCEKITLIYIADIIGDNLKINDVWCLRGQPIGFGSKL